MQHRVPACRPLELRRRRLRPVTLPVRRGRRTVDQRGDEIAPCRRRLGKRAFLVDRPALVRRAIAGESDDPARARRGREPAVTVVAGNDGEVVAGGQRLTGEPRVAVVALETLDLRVFQFNDGHSFLRARVVAVVSAHLRASRALSSSIGVAQSIAVAVLSCGNRFFNLLSRPSAQRRFRAPVVCLSAHALPSGS